MTDVQKTQRLRELVHGSGLTRRAVAETLSVTKRALDSWLLPVESRGHREPPDCLMALAEIKMKGGLVK